MLAIFSALAVGKVTQQLVRLCQYVLLLGPCICKKVGVEVNNGGALAHPYHKDTFSFSFLLILLSLSILVNIMVVWLYLCQCLMLVNLFNKHDYFVRKLTTPGVFLVKYEDLINGHNQFHTRYLWKLKSPL
jgi:hypothetical protein